MLITGEFAGRLVKLLEASEDFKAAYQRWETAAEIARYPESIQEVGEDHQIVSMDAIVKEMQEARANHEDKMTNLIVAAQNVAAGWRSIQAAAGHIKERSE